MKSNPVRSKSWIRARALDCRVSMSMVLLLSCAAILHAGRNPNSAVIPPGASPHGRTYGAWAAAWWNWALQIPLEQNPITDPTGAYGSAGQKGPVWFLAGTFEGSATRSITIPPGKRIFFPLYNVFNDYSCPDPDNQLAPDQSLEEFLTEGAESMSDMASGLFAELDDVPIQKLWDYRIHSDMEMFTIDPSMAAFNPCLTSGSEPAVVAGYWLMLAPLTRGQHTLHFGSTGRFGDFEFGVDVTYYLTVD